MGSRREEFQDLPDDDFQLHLPEFSQAECLVSPELAELIGIEPGQVLEIIQCAPGESPEEPALDETVHVVLQLTEPPSSGIRGALSVLKSVADELRLWPRYSTQLRAIRSEQQAESCGLQLDFLQLSFKDRFMSRSDAWRFSRHLAMSTPYRSKRVQLLGMSALVQQLLISADKAWPSMVADTQHIPGDQNPVVCGVVTSKTKVTFRSRSSHTVWLVQMSAEMWEFDEHHNLKFESFVNHFVTRVFGEWADVEANHCLSVVFFSRVLYDGPLENWPEQVRGQLQQEAGTEQLYRDFYKLVVQKEIFKEQESLRRLLKEEFVKYPDAMHSCDQPSQPASDLAAPAEKESPGPEPADADPLSEELEPAEPTRTPVGNNSAASVGNFLEATNLVLNGFERAFVGRDLRHTGQSIVVVTPGTGVFHVDSELAQLTKNRMVDNGTGCDLVCLEHKPLHAVALFVFKGHTAGERFNIPTWIHVSYFQPTNPYRSAISSQGFVQTCRMPHTPSEPGRVVRLQHAAEVQVTPKISQFGRRGTHQASQYQAHDAQVFTASSPPSSRILRASPSEGNIQNLLAGAQPGSAVHNRSARELRISPSVGNLGNLGNSAEAATAWTMSGETPEKPTTPTSKAIEAPSSAQSIKSASIFSPIMEDSALSSSTESVLKSTSDSESRSRASSSTSMMFDNKWASRYVNPFMADAEKRVHHRHRGNQAKLMRSTSQRWSHLLPDLSGRLHHTQDYSPKWDSLSQPALLPLTSSFFPSQVDLDHNYHDYVHTVFAMDFHLFNSRALLNELICARLSKDFQLVHSPNYNDSNPDRVYLALGHQFHRIVYDEDSNEIQVKIYRRRASAGIKARRYPYMLWSHEYGQYCPHHLIIDCVSHYRDDATTPGYKWNKLDQLLPMHTNLAIDGQDELNFNQAHYVVVPPQCPDNNDVSEGVRAIPK